ncbi:MAG TPA: hypothetical protein VF516_43840 [Kofleriaceae bacterium]
MLSLATVVGCSRAAQPQQPTSPPLQQLTGPPLATPWTMPKPGERVFSESAQRVQVIVTPGRRKGEQYAWVFSNGRKLEHFYRFTNNEANQLVAHLNDLQRTLGFSFSVVYHSCPAKPKTVGERHRSSPRPPSSEFAQTLPADGDPDTCGGSTTGGTTGYGGQPGEPPPPLTQAIVTDALDSSL